MRKSLKLIVALIMCSIMLFSLSIVHAYDGANLDTSGKMYLGNLITGGKGTVTISSSVTDYKLYSQSIEISDEKYNAIKSKSDLIESKTKEYKEELEGLKKELDALEAEIKGIEDTTSDEYQKKLDEYTEKLNACNTRNDECAADVEKLQNEYIALWPDFDDTKWTECEDGNFFVYSDEFRGNKNFFVWLKLAEPDDEVTYSGGYTIQEGTIKEESVTQIITTDETDFSLNIGESKDISITVTPEGTKVTWKSDNESIATVENGKVTAKGEGTATITATTEDGKYNISLKVTCIDNTKSKTRISDTGASYISLVAMIGVAIVAIILFKKVNSIKLN